MSTYTDVVICGSGSAGICAALWLAKAGISFKMLEKKSGPLQVGQADGVQCRTVEVFESFGIAEPLLKEAYHVIELAFWSSDGANGTLRRTDRAPDTPKGLSHQPHVILNQARVNEILLEEMFRRNPHQSINYGHAVRNVEIVEDGHSEKFPMRITTDHEGSEQTFRAKYVIGADGAHSTVRRCLGFKMIGDSSDVVWGVMDIYPDTDFPDIRRKCTIRSKYGVLIIIPREGGTLVRFYLQMPHGTIAQNVTLVALHRHAKTVLEGFQLDFKDTFWWSAYSIGQRVADQFSLQDRVFLAGDACHTHSPKAGQGMNTSLQDGYNLGWKLAQVLKGQIKPAVLQTYVLERGKVAADLIEFDRQLNSRLHNDRSTGVNMSGSSPAKEDEYWAHGEFQRYFVKSAIYMAGLSLSYGKSPITAHNSTTSSLARGVQVGMRMPSAQVVRYCDARAMQLATALKADLRWRILVFAGDLTQERTTMKLKRLERFLNSDGSPLSRFTKKHDNPDSFIELILVASGQRVEVEMDCIPLVFRPVTGQWSVRENHNIYFDDVSYNHGHGHAYDKFGIDKGEGATLILRPDQHNLANMVLKLSFSCWDYDRMKPLEDGRVRPDGIELNFLNHRVEETFFRQLRFHEFDVSELSLSSYVLTLNQENAPFIALPVFPSRYFRHQSMYVNTNSGIKQPSDLRHKRIGTPEYQMTAGVWQRGIMEEHFEVPITEVEFFSGAIEPSDEERKSKIPHSLPPGVRVNHIRPGQNLSQMLEDGELDAIFSASKPSSVGRSAHCTYLFPDFKSVEAEYYEKTKIFPIMHVVAIKRDVYEANPWVARSLQKAFAQSLKLAKEDLEDRSSLHNMLPWLEDHVRETKKVMGEDWWKDGFAENRHIIDKFLDYSYAQGLAKRKFKPEELFAPNTLEAFVL
ncbi:hypothetical protein CkaCkLH20_05307 [Colletotrichum karsti]|uniref:Phenol 2-monooxygenase n=1 Tax=Colletotrichum karsti TaxID=1095194 RepID=A0A9P6IAL7_9PEZI|nr:uncharacterized protein CkaCkLH20_05307 [Colletotrichum karsti]KAF9877041.1 hypothetical protein CkaCkLH20_05307 [Colletotrichum karsti]